MKTIQEENDELLASVGPATGLTAQLAHHLAETAKRLEEALDIASAALELAGNYGANQGETYGQIESQIGRVDRGIMEI
jgi:hypothetical protein